MNQRKFPQFRTFDCIFNEYMDWLQTTLEGNNDEIWKMDEQKIKKLNIFLNELRLLPSSDKKLGFDPLTNLSNLITKLNGELRILMDHQMRRISFTRPAQVTFFLTEDTPTGLYARRSSFNRPIFHYHYAPKNGSILSAHYKHVQEVILGIEYSLKIIQMRIYDDKVLFYQDDGKIVKLKKDDAGFGINPHYEKKEVFEPVHVEEQHAVAIFDKNYFILENGKIHDCIAKRNVDIYLNNQLKNGLSIRKLKFGKVINDSCELLILFDRLFMAQGTLRLRPEDRTNPFEYLFLCDVSEIPGSYGTTDFICSEDFKSFLRISCFSPTKPKKQRGLRKEEALLKTAISENLEVVLLHNVVRTMHQDKKILTHSNVVCQSIWITNSVFKKIQKGKCPMIPHFTARENLHYLYHTILKSDVRPHDKCEKNRCIKLENFLKICKWFVSGASFSLHEDIRIEFGYQLLSILDVLRHEFPFFKSSDHTKREILKSRLIFSNLYRLNAKKLYKVFFEVPSIIKPIILDILCKNAKQSEVNIVLDLYSSELNANRSGIKESEQLVVDAIRKHPNVIMFGRQPADIKLGLIKALGNFIDNSITYAGLYVDVESDYCDQINY